MGIRARPVALSIAGTDSGGGAGIVADAKTFDAHHVWAAVAVTAVTAQNTMEVSAVDPVDPGVVRAQIEAVVSDIGVDSTKTGMLASAEIVEMVADSVRRYALAPLVVDPVLGASTGSTLADPGLAVALGELLLPHAALVTPNLEEAAVLAGGEVRDRRSMEQAARELQARGAGAVLVTGGHLAGPPADCLVMGTAAEVIWIEGRRVPSADTHGTGCVLSAAIAANLALGRSMEASCRAAKRFVAGALGAGVALGAGPGAVDPGWCAAAGTGEEPGGASGPAW